MGAGPVALGSLLLILFTPLLASGERKAPALKSWIDGPVRYIAIGKEARQFRALKNDNDRALFIERFWSRRDPTPQTLTHEYRQLFWERVQEANAAFRGSTRPGWMTDRGKIYILYGPPTDIEREPDLRTDGIPGGGYGLIRWIYEGRPGGRLDLDAITVVAFVRDATGEYRMSHDPKLSSVFFNASDLRHQPTQPFGRWIENYLAPGRSELAVMLDLGKLQEVPPQEQVLLERVETIESYRTHPLRAQLARYRHPNQPGYVAVVTLDLSDFNTQSEPALIARFTPRDATAKPRIIGEGSFRIESSAAGRLAQGRIVLAPETYDVMLLAADPFDAGTGLYRGVMLIPKTTTRLHLSDVTLVRSLEPLAYLSLASYDEPFLVGPYKLVPRLGSSLVRGESVEVFFEVYGGQPPYRIHYQLEGQDHDGHWVALGEPQVIEHPQVSQAWGLPTTASWPLGPYRVQILVQDADQGSVSSTVPFSLGQDGTE